MVDKVQAYFSRLTPFYLIPANAMTDHEGFDAYPVFVSQDALDKAVALRAMSKQMTELFDDMPAPEERTQDEADAFATLLGLL